MTAIEGRRLVRCISFVSACTYSATTAAHPKRDMRDRAEEEMFFAIYGSSAVQAVLGVNSGEKVHALPGTTLEKRADRSGVCRRRCSKGEQRRVRRGAHPRGALRSYGRASARRALRACALRRAPRPDAAADRSVQNAGPDQFYVLLLERERVVEALATMVRETDQRTELLKRTTAIVGEAGVPSVSYLSFSTGARSILTTVGFLTSVAVR
jgi:hypothetical protein